VALRLTTAGESHGPALVAVVEGLPAGLALDRAAIEADLRRRQQGYGPSPRQQIETDEVEVLAGLRHGRTLGTPLALVTDLSTSQRGVTRRWVGSTPAPLRLLQKTLQVPSFGAAGTVALVRPRAGTLAALCLAVALAGCGGGSRPTTAQAELPRAVAEDLASKSDAVADALDAGDQCKAAQLADELKNAVETAVSGGEVPAVFQGELERNATDLQNKVNCEQKKQEEKGKKKGHKHESETTTLGTTVSTTTTTTGGND
jgi:hypothetical protein